MYTNGYNSIPVMAGLKKWKINQKIKNKHKICAEVAWVEQRQTHL